MGRGFRRQLGVHPEADLHLRPCTVDSTPTTYSHTCMANNTAVDLQYSESIMITGRSVANRYFCLTAAKTLNDLDRGAYEYMQHVQFEFPGVTCESRIAFYRPRQYHSMVHDQNLCQNGTFSSSSKTNRRPALCILINYNKNSY